MKKDNNHKRFYLNTIMQYFMTFAQYLFPLITFPYLTRVLEPEKYGIVTYITSTITYFQIFVDFGFNLSATKEIAEHQDDKDYIGKILGSVIQSKLILVVCSLIIYTIMMQFIPMLKDNILLSYLYMGTVVLSVWLPDFMFRGIEKMEIITVRFILSKSITTLLTFILVKSKNDILLIPILNIFGSLLAIILTWYYIKKKIEIKVSYSHISVVIGNIKQSAVYFMSTFATTAFGATNSFLLGTMNLPPSDIAYWGVSYNLINAAQSLYSPIVNSLYPHMIARKDFGFVKKILCIFMPAIIITTFVVNLLSKQVIYIFGGYQYLDAVPIFKALLPVLIFSFPAMVIGFPVLGVIGKVKETTYTTFISAIFHIGGLLVLVCVNRFTVLNVAILRSITEFVLFLARGVVLRKTRR